MRKKSSRAELAKAKSIEESKLLNELWNTSWKCSRGIRFCVCIGGPEKKNIKYLNLIRPKIFISSKRVQSKSSLHFIDLIVSLKKSYFFFSEEKNRQSTKKKCSADLSS
ncbi:hypothetical protein NH340_JMT04047 [Sarcoptes scabiei]|nr:hypothetical protein NH340_JMT04047 [Sarcoptes scabiei]